MSNNNDYIELSKEAQHIITPQQAWHYHIIPNNSSGSKCLYFYIDIEMYNPQLTDELEVLFGKAIHLEQRSTAIISKTLKKYYRSPQSPNSIKKEVHPNFSTDDFLPTLISEAKNLGSSDLHIETYEDKCRVRIRIDGLLIVSRPEICIH